MKVTGPESQTGAYFSKLQNFGIIKNLRVPYNYVSAPMKFCSKSPSRFKLPGSSLHTLCLTCDDKLPSEDLCQPSSSPGERGSDPTSSLLGGHHP